MVAVTEWESSGNVHLLLNSARKPRPHHKTVARLAAERLPEGGTMLDLGCGMGDIPMLVRDRIPNAKIAIADAYQVCLDATTDKLGDIEAAYLLPEDDFDPGSVIDTQYDVVTMSHVIEHLLDPVAGLKRAMERVKPGGCLVLAAPNPARPDSVILNLFQRHYVNRGHVCAWDPSHWRNFLERIMGLNVEAYAADAVYLAPGVLGRLLASVTGETLAKLAPWWAFSNIAVIRKDS